MYKNSRNDKWRGFYLDLEKINKNKTHMAAGLVITEGLQRTWLEYVSEHLILHLLLLSSFSFFLSGLVSH